MTNAGIITNDELTNKIESVTIGDKHRICGELLLTALNDWPTLNLTEPRELLDELKNEIKQPLTSGNLRNYADRLSLHISGNAWKMESVASLLKMYDFNRDNNSDREVTLDKIIQGLTEYFGTVK